MRKFITGLLPADEALTPEQAEWLSFYDTLSPEDLEDLRAMARSMAKRRKKKE